MMTRIRVSKLGKAYRQYKSKISKLKTVLLASRNQDNFNHKWILRNINFTVNAGEAVGIIGINGAGKSTLLKLITGTTTATEGCIEINGRIAALLELGMGFHPEFTGRQNVYMSGQLLGMTVPEINEHMSSIISFAEIGDYIDQPVRVYSSGMQVRLAFSVATAIRPDILIIDEALSVGDAYFQHKSFERIKQFKNNGTSLLLVSHDKQAIQSICDKALLLANGRKILEGKPEEVLDHYNALLAERGKAINSTVALQSREKTSDESGNKTVLVSGSGEVDFISVGLYDSDGELIEVGKVGQSVSLRLTLKIMKSIPELVVGYVIKDRFGREIFGTNTFYMKRVIYNLSEGELVTYEFNFPLNVGEGNYSISVAAHRESSHVVKNYMWKDVAVIFSVVNVGYNSFIGSSWIPPVLECSH